MEFLTSSPGVMVVLNRCDHMPVYRETKTTLYRASSASGLPSVSSLVQIPRSPSRGLTYGSGVIMPNQPTILRSSSVVSGGPIACAKRRAGVPQYDAINDPHLRDYFERKFKLSSAKKKKFKVPKPGPNECIYKIRVRTSNLINAGTDAKVFLTIAGYQFTVPRTRLFNKYDAVRTENGFKYKFERNSTNTFKIVGVDVHQISHIIIEHDGREMLNSWHLQDIQITHSKSHRTWLFECNDWLSLEHGLGKTRIQLTPTRLLEKYNETDYEVVVVTGDRRMAGTDSTVFVTLFGPRNRSTHRLELKGGNNKDPFETGQTDVFKLTNINYVGPIEKVRVEHDNSGKAPGWFLERVVVTDLKDPKVKYFCPCSRWLSKDEDDGQISRDLVATNDLFSIQKIGKYRITVFTGNKRGAGTDADVNIVLYGSLGDTGEWRLDDEKNNFERGMKDEFEIECPSIGELKRIRIGHNNKGVGAGWFLNKVIVDDLEKGKVSEFLADRWLAEDEADGKTTVYLFPSTGIGNNKHDKTLPYTVTVYTGDVSNAGTSSKVFIELFGGGGSRENKSSGRIVLTDGEFDRGMADKLFVHSPHMLTPVEELLIGHDNSGIGPGWFLDRVEVECPVTGMLQTFPCGKWFAKDEGDGRIERILKENTSLRREGKAQTAWNVSVYTSDMKNAGTDANVYVCMYGDLGKTDEVYLRNKSNNFETGKCDSFKISTNKIGIPFKMRIGHDNKGLAAGWHLDKVEVENLQSKERFVFHCNRWLSKDEEDGEIVREMPAEGETARKPLPIVNYIVEVETGKKFGSGTDANVFLNLFGDYGDTGDRPLARSKTNRNKFENNQVDVFSIEAVQLKHFQKIRIGHDGKNSGDGWYLKRVTVKQEGNAKYEHTFDCNRWLATDEDDGQIVREFLVDAGEQLLNTTSYHVRVKTGDKRSAGTDADVSLKIFGARGDTGNQVLRKSNNAINKFESGKVDEFDFEHEDVGKIERIKIGHNGRGIGAGWFLDWLEIDVPAKGLRYKFAAHRWLAEDEDDRQTTIELFPTEVKKMRKYIPYVLTLKTGDKRGAGTDANVFVQFYGQDGKSEEYFLDNKSDNFERGQEDVFKIEADDVGPLFKVRIGHDDGGSNAGWFLESLRIVRNSTKSKRNLRSREDVRDTEEYFFLVNKWFARDEDDKQIVREIMPTDERGRPLVVLDEIPYEVKVFTGTKRGAGTDSNVFMTIYGSMGDSGERELRKSNNRNKFEDGQVDEFKVKAVDLGDLEKIKIGHDNSGFGAAWYLEKVEIFNPNSQRTYLFNCQNWLSKNEGDGKITRELPAIDPEMLRRVKFRDGAKELKDQILLETEALTITYNITVVTSDIRGAGTDANVFIQLYGERNDSGRHELKFSKTNKNKFETGQTDVFDVKVSDVGDLRKIKIGHDGSGFGDGWHLKEVIVDAPKLGKRWKFPCNRWFDKSEDDGRIERTLEPSDLGNEEYQPKVMYEVDVFTSDLAGADTTANPYIVIYGEDMKTEKMELCRNKAERRDKFKRGQVDRFCLELDDVGEVIRKIRIGHDDKGMFSGWHVKKVEIRRLKSSGKGSNIHVFPCNRWLARDEDDRAIERDLVVGKIIDEKRSGESREREVRDKLAMKDYVVEVYTGNESRAGTNANVFLTLFGEFGDTGEKALLKSQTHTDKFERNQMDRFVIQAADLGRVFKAVVRHDDSGFSSDWFLDKIKVGDGRESYLFNCERWLSKSKEDKAIERTLFEKNYRGPRSTSKSSMLNSKIGGSTIAGSAYGSQSKLSLRNQSPRDARSENFDGPTLNYTITIRTGDERSCGNSGQVFIRLIGARRKQDTGRLKLRLARQRRFEPGSAEVFQVEALDIGDLKQVELGHDGIGRDCNWLVKSIEIKEPISGLTYNITCNSWLSTERGDGLTVRTFNVDEATTKIMSAEGMVPYTLSIQTGDVAKAGTDSSVTLKFFGTKGTSSEIFVEKMEDRFERASNVTLPIELEDVGSLKKVRCSIDGRGVRKEWFLNYVEVTNMLTRKQYLFVAEEWLSKTKRDSRGLTVDIPLFKGGQETIQKTDYKIHVKTSNLKGAGTNSNVFIIMFGQNGDSGELELKKSETNFDKFEQNRTDIFIFKGMLSLGELVKLRIWHDNTGSFIGNSNWHCESVRVEDLATGRSFMFKCNKWLSLSKDDKQVVRELKPDISSTGADERGMGIAETPRQGERTSYEVTVMTADEPNAGTRQNAMIVLIGESGMETKPKFIENTYQNSVLRRGHSDVISFATKSVGSLKKILLAHVSKADDPPRTRAERNAPWICSQVIVKDLGTDTKYAFPVMEPLLLDQEPKMFRLESKREGLVSKSRQLTQVKYEVTVVTGSDKSAGTSASGSMTLFGTNGDSGRRPLKKGFAKDDVDKFTIECIDLGELKKVNIEHDNSGFRKSWQVERVEVTDSKTGQTYVFPCQKWLSKSKEDGEIQRDLFPLTNKRSASRSTSKSPRTSVRDFGFDRQSSREDMNMMGGGRPYAERPSRASATRPDVFSEFDNPRGSARGSRQPMFNEFDERPARGQRSNTFDELPVRGQRSNTFDEMPVRSQRSNTFDEMPVRGQRSNEFDFTSRGSARDFERPSRDMDRGGVDKMMSKDIDRQMSRDFDMPRRNSPRNRRDW